MSLCQMSACIVLATRKHALVPDNQTVELRLSWALWMHRLLVAITDPESCGTSFFRVGDGAT